MKTQLEKCCGIKTKYHRTPSMHNNEPAGNTARVAPTNEGKENHNTEAMEGVKKMSFS